MAEKAVDKFAKDEGSTAGKVRNQREERQKKLCSALGRSYDPSSGKCSPKPADGAN